MLGLGALTAEITGGGMLAKIEEVEMGIAGPYLAVAFKEAVALVT